jgi:hypothetical protein
MIYIIFFTFLITAICILVHSYALYYLKSLKIKKINYIIFTKFFSVLILSHLIHICIFALFYDYSFNSNESSKLFGGNVQNSFIDFFYYSISCYTTLGIGDVYPLGNMRITTGIEALVGLMLIAWTATFKLSYLFKIRR